LSHGFFSICICWIVLAGGPGVKNESFVVLVVVGPDDKPRRSRPANGLVTVGGAIGGLGLDDNKSCCCCWGGNNDAFVNVCCCWGTIGVVLKSVGCVCWGNILP